MARSTQPGPVVNAANTTTDSSTPLVSTMSTAVAMDEAPDRPVLWDRYGWLYAALWLGFLVFPFAAIAQSSHSARVKTLGVGVLIAFAVVYLLGFRGCLVTEDHNERWPYVAVLTGLVLVLVPVIGYEVLGMASYLTSFAMIVMSFRAGLWVTLVAVLVTVATAVVVNPRASFFLLIIIPVALGTGLSRKFAVQARDAQEIRWASRVTEDRDRVARDVHDVLGHSLTVIVLKSELAERLIATDPQRARDELAQIQSIARTSLGEIRTTVGALRGTRLEEEIATARAALSSADIDLDAPDDPMSVEPRARVTVAWTVREATTNVLRHSGATKVVVRWGPDWVTVTDNGRGMGAAKEGNGLTGVRERVAAVGGTVDIGVGDDGVGTRVEVRQP